jgi:hypothetical protein
MELPKFAQESINKSTQKVEPKVEAKTEVKAEVKAETKSDPKIDTKVETQITFTDLEHELLEVDNNLKMKPKADAKEKVKRPKVSKQALNELAKKYEIETYKLVDVTAKRRKTKTYNELYEEIKLAKKNKK